MNLEDLTVTLILIPSLSIAPPSYVNAVQLIKVQLLTLDAVPSSYHIAPPPEALVLIKLQLLKSRILVSEFMYNAPPSSPLLVLIKLQLLNIILPSSEPLYEYIEPPSDSECELINLEFDIVVL